MESGRIRNWGVSNFNAIDLAELITVADGTAIETDQVSTTFAHRELEYGLLPWCRDWSLPVMAYSPTDQGRLLDHPRSSQSRHHVSPSQVAIAWVLRRHDISAVAKAATPAHVRENRAALDLRLTRNDLTTLNLAFPPPTERQPLVIYRPGEGGSTMVEPGLDLHEWATRWQELQDMAADEPAETLPEIVRFVEQMLRERRILLEEPVTAEGDDPGVIRDFLAARDVADAVAAGGADPEDIMVALDNLREIYEYLVTDRAAP